MFLLRRFDLLTFLPAAFLVALGSLILTSVSPSSYPQHIFYVIGAFLAFSFFAVVDIRIFRQLSPLFYVISIILLIVTLTFGGLVRGSSRWIYLGPIGFQPSELAKPILVLFFSHIIASRLPLNRFIATGLTFIPPFLLVFLQPDLGSSITILLGFVGVIFFGGLPLWICISGIVGSVLAMPIFWRFLADYQKQRIFSFLSPTADRLGTGYNSIQAVIAIGSGGLFGRGLGQGTQSQLAFLPERHTDFIFAALSEELGFLGAGSAVVAFALILYRIITVLRNDDDTFSQALLGGIFFIFFAHIAVNIGMNLGVLPITGIPLPFISAGGSALLSMSAMLGMVSNIAYSLKRKGDLGII